MPVELYLYWNLSANHSQGECRGDPEMVAPRPCKNQGMGSVYPNRKLQIIRKGKLLLSFLSKKGLKDCSDRIVACWLILVT